LNNLAIQLAGVGQRQAALEPAQQAVTIRRALAEANPDAYLPDLAASLNNLANRLAEVGRAHEAADVWESAIGDSEEPARRYLELEYARHLLHQAGNATALRLLGTLTTSSGVPSSVVAGARQLLREQWRNDPSIDRKWAELSDIPPPRWLHLTDAEIRLVIDWINTETWGESHTFASEHAERLLATTTDVVLDELELRAPGRQIETHRELLQAVRGHGIDAAYRPLLLDDVLRAWLATPDWDASESYLSEHPELLGDDAADALRALGGDSTTPVIAIHDALRTLAASPLGVTDAYRCLHDRSRLDAVLTQAIAAHHADQVRACGILEQAGYGLAFLGAVHALTAGIVRDPAGEIPQDEAAQITALAAEADVDDRNRAGGQLAALLPTLPAGHALAHLLQLILAPSES
jgi:hypothetical protein